MDLYTLDPVTLTKTEVIDSFQSLIWTERYNDSGDVTLVFPEESSLTDLVVEGIFLGLSDSVDVMQIDTVSTEKGLTTATGPSLTAFLLQRILRYAWDNVTDTHMLTGSAGAIAAQIISDMVMPSGLMALNNVVLDGHYEAIPNLALGPIATGVSISVALPNGTVYDSVKQVCDLDGLGFRMYPPSIMDGSGDLIFTTYRGRDLTTDQSTNQVVVFEPAMDSFTDSKTLRSISGYKNVAYVWPTGNITSRSQVVTVYAAGANYLTGFSRRTMMVIADDIDVANYPSASDLTAVLTQRGKDELANNNYIRMTDGQLVPQNAYTYGSDYTLGDIIELRGPSNVAQQARISEYIRSQDTSGEMAYPTLSVI